MTGNAESHDHEQKRGITRRTVVKAGRRENTASIARRYRVSVADVANWNDVSASSAFKVGEQVVLYLPVRAGSMASGASRNSSAKARASSSTKSTASASRSTSAGKKSAAAPVKRGGEPAKKKR